MVGFLDWDVPGAQSAANVGVLVEVLEYSSGGLVVGRDRPGAGAADRYTGFGEDDSDLGGADPQFEGPSALVRPEVESVPARTAVRFWAEGLCENVPGRWRSRSLVAVAGGRPRIRRGRPGPGRG